MAETAMPEPVTNRAGSATQKMSVAVKTRRPSPATSTKLTAMTVRPLIESRIASHSAPQPAPNPVTETIHASASAPRPKTPAAKPGSRSMKGRARMALTINSPITGPMPGWDAM